MSKTLHPRDDNHRLYESRKEEVLGGIEDNVDVSMQRLEDYT